MIYKLKEASSIPLIEWAGGDKSFFAEALAEMDKQIRSRYKEIYESFAVMIGEGYTYAWGKDVDQMFEDLTQNSQDHNGYFSVYYFPSKGELEVVNELGSYEYQLVHNSKILGKFVNYDASELNEIDADIIGDSEDTDYFRLKTASFSKVLFYAIEEFTVWCIGTFEGFDGKKEDRFGMEVGNQYAISVRVEDISVSDIFPKNSDFLPRKEKSPF